MTNITEFRVLNIAGEELVFTDNLGGFTIPFPIDAPGYLDLLGPNIGFQENDISASDDLLKFVQEGKVLVVDQFGQSIDVFNFRQIWSLATGEAAQNQRIEDLEALTVLIQSDIETLVDKDTAHDAKDFEHDSRLSALDAGQDAQDLRLSGIDTLNVAQSNRLTVVENKNDVQDTRLQTAETSLSLHSGRLSSIENDNTAQSVRLSAIESKDAIQDGQLASMATKDTQHDAKILALETDVTAKTIRIATLESANLAKTAQITTLQSEVVLLKQWQGGVILPKITTWSTQSTFMGFEYYLTASNAGLVLVFAPGNLQDGDKCIVNNARTTVAQAKLTTGFSLDIPTGRHWVTYNKAAGTLTRLPI